MSRETGVPAVHPAGEQPMVELASAGPVTAETFAGRVHLEWEAVAPVMTICKSSFLDLRPFANPESALKARLAAAFAAAARLTRVSNARRGRARCGGRLVHRRTSIRAGGAARRADRRTPQRQSGPVTDYHDGCRTAATRRPGGSREILCRTVVRICADGPPRPGGGGGGAARACGKVECHF